MIRVRLFFLVLLALVPLPGLAQKPFVHPGLLHTRADLERVKTNIAAQTQPITAGFLKFKADSQSSAAYRASPGFEHVTRDKASIHNHEMVVDGNAAYQNALMWCLTGDEAHARKSVAILNAWAKLKSIDGHDAHLAAGLNGFKFVSAAELMRHTYAWPSNEVVAFERMLRTAVLPVIKDFATFANGNWDGACLKTIMAMGVFCDDRALFDRAVDYFRSGPGNGSLTHYIINEAGQCQESGRDQSHTQLGLGQIAEACEIAWNQGLDLYGTSDNRLLKGFEYTARYNLGEDVPFVPYTDKTGKSRHRVISKDQRGRLRPIYEMVLNHYHVRCGLPLEQMPWTRRAAEKLRPEGAGFAGDHVGFGTLFFTRQSSLP